MLKWLEFIENKLIKFHDKVVLRIQKIQPMQLLLFFGKYLFMLIHVVRYDQSTWYHGC